MTINDNPVDKSISNQNVELGASKTDCQPLISFENLSWEHTNPSSRGPI